MRPIVLFLIGLLAACSPVPPPAKPPPAKPPPQPAVDLTAKTVALVDENDEGETRAYCTGTWVGASNILTAAHCVADVESGLVGYATHADVYAPIDLHVRKPMTRKAALLAAVDVEHDLALLFDPTPAPHASARVRLDVRPGERVQTLGHPIGLWFSYSTGDVAAVRYLDLQDDKPPRVWVQATPPISPGSSGGGLFDLDGNLVGVVSGYLRRGQQLNLFVHPQYVDAFVRKYQGP